MSTRYSLIVIFAKFAIQAARGIVSAGVAAPKVKANSGATI